MPAEGLLADGAEEEEEGAAVAVGLAATEASGGGADVSAAGAAGEATAATGGMEEGGEAGPADTTMAGTGLEPVAETVTLANRKSTGTLDGVLPYFMDYRLHQSKRKEHSGIYSQSYFWGKCI